MPIGVLQQGDDGDSVEDDANVDVDAAVDECVQGGFPGRYASGDHWSRRDSSPVGRVLVWFPD